MANLERRLNGRRIKRTQRVGDNIVVVYHSDIPGQRAESEIVSFEDYQSRVTKTLPGSSNQEQEEVQEGATGVALVVVGVLTGVVGALFFLARLFR